MDRPPRDPRYGSSRWQTVRIRVLNRDRWTCQVELGCPVRGDVCDHIIEVYEGMPDRLFFGMGNLRAACRGHNLARGMVPEIASDGAPSAIVTEDFT